MERLRGGEPPSAWLAEHQVLVAAQHRGRALDVACGTGRNARLLAGLGFEVDAIDVDEAALEAVRGIAGPVRAIAADVTATELPRPPYDVIVNLNFLERAILPRLGDALAPDGLLIFETFTRDHVDVLGRRMNPAYLLEPNELLRAFADLRVLHYREAVVDGDRPRAVASLVARRRSAQRGRSGAAV